MLFIFVNFYFTWRCLLTLSSQRSTPTLWARWAKHFSAIVNGSEVAPNPAAIRICLHSTASISLFKSANFPSSSDFQNAISPTRCLKRVSTSFSSCCVFHLVLKKKKMYESAAQFCYTLGICSIYHLAFWIRSCVSCKRRSAASLSVSAKCPLWKFLLVHSGRYLSAAGGDRERGTSASGTKGKYHIQCMDQTQWRFIMKTHYTYKYDCIPAGPGRGGPWPG